MNKTFRLIVSSVAGARFDGEVISATLPGSAGEMTILAGHEPLITTLKGGVVAIKKADGTSEAVSIENGVLECTGTRVTVLI